MRKINFIILILFISIILIAPEEKYNFEFNKKNIIKNAVLALEKFENKTTKPKSPYKLKNFDKDNPQFFTFYHSILKK